MVEKVWKDVYRGKKPRRGDVRREVWEVQDRSGRNDRKKGKASAKKEGGLGKKNAIRGMMIERRERLALRKVESEKKTLLYGGLREGIGTKTYLHGPVDFAKTLKLRIRVGNLDLPKRRRRYTITGDRS